MKFAVIETKLTCDLSRRSHACCVGEALPILTIYALLNPELWDAKPATNSWFRYAGLTTVKTMGLGMRYHGGELPRALLNFVKRGLP